MNLTKILRKQFWSDAFLKALVIITISREPPFIFLETNIYQQVSQGRKGRKRRSSLNAKKKKEKGKMIKKLVGRRRLTKKKITILEKRRKRVWEMKRASVWVKVNVICWNRPSLSMSRWLIVYVLEKSKKMKKSFELG